MTGEYSQEDGVTFIDGGNIGDPPGEIESGEALVTVRCRNCNYVAHFDLKGIQDEVRKWKAQ